MAHSRSITGVVVCVEFDDFLGVTLPRNKKHFSTNLVITSPKDVATQAIAKANQCRCFVTDAFYDEGAMFNKGLAIEKAISTLDVPGWFCFWDADIVMPKSIQEEYDTGCLYTPYRRSLENPLDFNDDLNWETVTSIGPKEYEFPGYFQLFHSDGAGPRPWYPITWRHAGGYDSDFQRKFKRGRLRRPSFEVLHLGPTVDGLIEDMPARVGANWCGRTIPRLDTNQPPEKSSQREKQIQKIISGRRESNVGHEQLSPSIPRCMNFFWTGRLSWLRWLTLTTFIKYNPDWRVYLYKPDVPTIPKHWSMDTDDDWEYQGADYTDRIPPQVHQCTYSIPGSMASAQMCDWFQWHLLAEEGGFFADMDIIWTAPLDPVWKTVRHKSAVFCLESGVMAIGLVAALPQCQLFQELATSLPTGANRDYQHYGTSMVYRFAGIRSPIKPASKPGDEALKRLRRHYKGNVDIGELPSETVYPLEWNQVDEVWKGQLPVDPKSVGIHWFGGSELSHYWNYLLAEDTWRNHRNTLTNYLEQALL